MEYDRARMTNSAEFLSPASEHDQRRAEHELVDMGAVALALYEQDAAGGSHGPRKQTVSLTTHVSRVSPQKGVCAYSQCQIVKPKRPQNRCFACRDGRGAYYHLQCFFAVHRCLKE